MNTLGQDTAKKSIVPIDTVIASKIVKDLERYDLCVIQRESLLNETSILNEKLVKKDSLLKFNRMINKDLKLIIESKNTQIDQAKKRVKKVKKQRNVIAGSAVLGIILIILL